MRELIATQLEDGYLGTYTPQERFIDYGDKGYEPAENLPLWDVWAHKYNLLGLLNYYRRTGYEPALQASRRIGDLLCKTYGDAPGQKDIVRNDWHVGMANTSVLEPMAMLYRYTGDRKYLEFCRYIVRAWDEPKGPKIADDPDRKRSRQRGRQRQGLRDDVESRRAPRVAPRDRRRGLPPTSPPGVD